MLFASFPYILVFLPIVVIVCIIFGRIWGPKAAQASVLLASVVFYARSKPSNLVFLALSILINWILGREIERSKAPLKKRLLVTGLVLNVLYLCTFKYLDFFASMISFALPHGYVIPKLPFPLGISFFTITQIMYLVDCYEGILKAGSLFDHASFVAFFPYVISGPLGRAKRMRHQFPHFGGKSGERSANISRGLYHFAMGLFKKCVFADTFARVSSYGDSVGHASATEAWIFGIAYAMRIYFDFSGYSDMAIGSAMMLGIEIPRNFDAPYTSKSIIEFWQRWHISLTGFITSYLYTPILRSFKKATVMTGIVATFVAMGIAGLWHGPAWTYVIYGLLHGAALGVNQLWRKKKMPRIPPFISWALTFVFVVVAFAYFGATSVPEGTQRVITLFNPHLPFATNHLGRMNNEALDLHVFGLPLLVGIAVSFFGKSSEEKAREFTPTAFNCAYSVALISIAFVFLNTSFAKPFIYFKF
jgi:alginate O-acetyltransferase complex protein AlgI